MPEMEMRETASNQIGSFQAAIGEKRIASFVSKSHRPGRKTPKAIKGKGRSDSAFSWESESGGIFPFCSLSILQLGRRGEVSLESSKDERLWMLSFVPKVLFVEVSEPYSDNYW
jgi:hypothetical protein